MIDLIITNYNGYKMTEDLVNQIFDITEFDKPYRIIVVDNSPVKKRFKLKQSDKLIILENNNQNKSYPAGLNIGIKYSENDVVFMNNDLIIRGKDWLMNLYNEAYSDDKIGLVDLTGSVNNPYGKRLQPLESILSQNLSYLNVDVRYRVSFVICYVKRSIINNVGLVDEHFYRGCDDVDYSVRCLLNGFTVSTAFADYSHFGSADTKRENKDVSLQVRECWQYMIDKWNHLLRGECK